MANLLETSASNIEAFQQTSVGAAEPLFDSLALAKENPKLVGEKFYAYYTVVRDLFNLAPEELNLIASVNEKLGSSRGAHQFIEAMGDQKEQILSQMRQIGDLENPHNQAGIDNLTRMMNNAWEIKQSDPEWTPKDGDPKADQVIWGFVKGATNPEIDIDFSICHGIERTLTDSYPDHEYTQHKDWLLCALNDVIALRGLQGRGYEKDLLPVWDQPRPEGLGWISQRRINAYKDQISKEGNERSTANFVMDWLKRDALNEVNWAGSDIFFGGLKYDWSTNLGKEPPKSIAEFLQTTLYNADAKRIGLENQKRTGLGQPGLEIILPKDQAPKVFAIELSEWEAGDNVANLPKVTQLLPKLLPYPANEGEKVFDYLSRIGEENDFNTTTTTNPDSKDKSLICEIPLVGANDRAKLRIAINFKWLEDQKRYGLQNQLIDITIPLEDAAHWLESNRK